MQRNPLTRAPAHARLVRGHACNQEAFVSAPDVEKQLRPCPSVQCIRLGGLPMVAKFPRSAAKSWLAACLTCLACGVAFGEYPDPAAMRRDDPRHEVRRLRTLYAQGQPVPQVYLETERYFVQQYCGRAVDQILPGLPGHAQRRLLLNVTDDLVAFHAAGHWHGAAQLRNLTLQDGRRYRIDFEEPVGEVLSLPLAQAFDVILLFSSMTDALGQNIGLGADLLAHYLNAWPSSLVAANLARLDQGLRWLIRHLPWLDSDRAQRNVELRRTLTLSRVLRVTQDRLSP